MYKNNTEVLTGVCGGANYKKYIQFPSDQRHFFRSNFLSSSWETGSDNDCTDETATNPLTAFTCKTPECITAAWLGLLSTRDQIKNALVPHQMGYCVI